MSAKFVNSFPKEDIKINKRITTMGVKFILNLILWEMKTCKK